MKVNPLLIDALLAPLKAEPPKRGFTLPDLRLDPSDYMHLHKYAVSSWEAARESYKNAKDGEVLAHQVLNRARITLDEIEHALHQYQRSNNLDADVVKFRLWSCSICGSSEVENAGDLCSACSSGEAA